MDKAIRNRRTLLSVFVFVILLFLYGRGLNFPFDWYYDEVYHAKRVSQIALLQQYNHRTSIHPPLWHYFSTLSVKIFGYHSAAWRLPSLICGILCVFLLYRLAKVVSRSAFVAYGAAFLFAFDCISITQARIGMLNSMMLMFMLLSILCYFQYLMRQKWGRAKALLWAGIFLGAALTTRLVGAYLYIFYIGLLFLDFKRAKMPLLKFLLQTIACLVFIPLIIYVGIYISIPLLNLGSWSDLLTHQEYAKKGLHVSKSHRYGSEFWEWPILKRPIWYHFEKSDGVVRGIFCIGNPVIFWMMPVTFLYMLYKIIREKSLACTIVLFGFLSLWLPWALVERVKFFHFFQMTMPFVCMATALMLQDLWKVNRLGQLLVVIYLMFVLLMFFYWYPMLVGDPVTYQQYQDHMWFKKLWI